MPAGDSMPDTYIAIMLQSLKKKEQVLDEIIRLDDRQKDTLTDPECPFDGSRSDRCGICNTVSRTS